MGNPIDPRICATVAASVQAYCASQVPLVASGEARQIKVWEFDGTALDQGDIAAEWITTYLGEPHRLVRYAGQPNRSICLHCMHAVLWLICECYKMHGMHHGVSYLFVLCVIAQQPHVFVAIC